MKTKNLWKYIFPLLALALWIATIILLFKSNSSYHTGDYATIQAIEKAARWQPACCIGAIISTALSFVIGELVSLIEENRKEL